MLLLLKYQDTTTCVMFMNGTSNVDKEGVQSFRQQVVSPTSRLPTSYTVSRFANFLLVNLPTSK